MRSPFPSLCRLLGRAILMCASLALTACAPPSLPDLAALLPSVSLPAMRWDARPEAAVWTRSALQSVAARDAALAAQVPGDIDAFCPGYAKATMANRRAFWVGLMSATAKYESGFNPAAVGGGGRYIGLMQISPRSAANYGCDATSKTALKDGSANLACAVQIFSDHVATDGMVAGSGNRGIARDWGPYHAAATRRAIAGWTSQQAYCQG